MTVFREFGEVTWDPETRTYYFAIALRRPRAKVARTVKVEVTLDVSGDGTLMGLEIVDPKGITHPMAKGRKWLEANRPRRNRFPRPTEDVAP